MIPCARNIIASFVFEGQHAHATTPCSSKPLPSCVERCQLSGSQLLLPKALNADRLVGNGSLVTIGMVVGVAPVVVILVGTDVLAVGISAIPIARLVHGPVVVLAVLVTILVIVVFLLVVLRLVLVVMVVLAVLVGVVAVGGGLCDGRQDDQDTDGDEWADHDDHVKNSQRTRGEI